MKNLLICNNQETTSYKEKFVFVGLEIAKSKASGTTPPPRTESLGESMERKFNTSLNVETNFNPEYLTVLKDLGKKAQEKNPELNPESIKTNITETLAPGKTIEEVWKYLQENGCQTALINDGHLKFFKAGSEEISLTGFFKTQEMKIGGEGTITHEYLLRKQEKMQETMLALADLKNHLPELPSQKIS